MKKLSQAEVMLGVQQLNVLDAHLSTVLGAAARFAEAVRPGYELDEDDKKMDQLLTHEVINTLRNMKQVRRRVLGA